MYYSLKILCYTEDSADSECKICRVEMKRKTSIHQKCMRTEKKNDLIVFIKNKYKLYNAKFSLNKKLELYSWGTNRLPHLYRRWGCARACTRSLLLSRQPTVTRDTSYNDIKINLCCVFNITKKKKLTVLLWKCEWNATAQNQCLW